MEIKSRSLFSATTTTIGTFCFLFFSVINCVSSTPTVSPSSPLPAIGKKGNSVNIVSSPLPTSSSSPSPLPTIYDQPPVDSYNSINSVPSNVRIVTGNSHPGELTGNSKPLPNILPGYQIRRHAFNPVRALHSNQRPMSSGSSLSSSFSSAFSPSKLFPSLFSSSSSPFRSSLPVHPGPLSSSSSSSPSSSSSFALRPLNRLIELWHRNDYSPSNEDSFNSPPKVYHHLRRQQSQPQVIHHGDKLHLDHGNSLSSPAHYSTDHVTDLTKQAALSRAPWFSNPFQRRSTIRSIVERFFG